MESTLWIILVFINKIQGLCDFRLPCFDCVVRGDCKYLVLMNTYGFCASLEDTEPEGMMVKFSVDINSISRCVNVKPTPTPSTFISSIDPNSDDSTLNPDYKASSRWWWNIIVILGGIGMAIIGLYEIWKIIRRIMQAVALNVPSTVTESIEMTTFSFASRGYQRMEEERESVSDNEELVISIHPDEEHSIDSMIVPEMIS